MKDIFGLTIQRGELIWIIFNRILNPWMLFEFNSSEGYFFCVTLYSLHVKLHLCLTRSLLFSLSTSQVKLQ